MTNIAEQINMYLDNDFVVRKFLFNNIISLRALARYIVSSLELKEKNME